MGVETLDDGVLDAVHRENSAAETLGACRMVVESGRELNVDLIYGLPGQTETSFHRDLDAVAATGVSSLCLYALRLNENTPVRARLAAEERLDLLRLMRWRAFVTRVAEEAGFSRARCYQFRCDGGAPASQLPVTRAGSASHQLGIGMSARSQLGAAVYRNHERSHTYMQRVEQGSSPVESVFPLDVADRKTQFVAASLGNGLVLERAAYQMAFGSAIDADFDELLERLRGAELIEDDGTQIVLTEIGMLVYDRVLLCFYPQRAKRWLGASAAATSAVSS
jgi:oxygen-independent coproporphyrinogen-3 oxidase